MLSVHSMKPIGVKIEEITCKNEFDSLVNIIILKQFGQEVEKRAGQYRIL